MTLLRDSWGCPKAHQTKWQQSPNRSLLSPRSLVQENPEVALDCMMYMSQHISPAERAQVTHLLSTMDSPAST